MYIRKCRLSLSSKGALRLPYTHNSMIAKPSVYEDSLLFRHPADVSALTAGSQFFQPLLRYLQGSCMDSNAHDIQYSLSSTFASGNKTVLIEKNTTLSKKVKA